MPRLIRSRRTDAGPGGAGGRRADAPGARSGRLPDRTAAPEPAPGTGFGVPAFAHPLVAPAEWAELARPGAPLHWVAFDVRRGPGTRRDPLYGEALGRVRENGVPVLGLLDAAYGTRPFGELVSDASHYLDWYRVDGFYLDRAPTLRSGTAECQRVVTTLRALLDGDSNSSSNGDSGGECGGGTAGDTREPRSGTAAGGPAPPARHPVVLAPGCHPYCGYADFADQIVTFDGPWNRYRWSEAPQWTAAYPPTRFAHLVHGLPAAHLDTALRIARWQGAGTVCLTDRTDRDAADPWAGLPGYWHDAVRKAGRPG
jgi:hypothetical protein